VKPALTIINARLVDTVLTLILSQKNAINAQTVVCSVQIDIRAMNATTISLYKMAYVIILIYTMVAITENIETVIHV